MQKNVHYILRFKYLDGRDLDPDDPIAQISQDSNLYIFQRGHPIPRLAQAKACVDYNPASWMNTHRIVSVTDNELTCETIDRGWHITYANLNEQDVEFIISSIREYVS